jgi:hypothetical protein
MPKVFFYSENGSSVVFNKLTGDVEMEETPAQQEEEEEEGEGFTAKITEKINAKAAE